MKAGRFETFSKRPIVDCYLFLPDFGVDATIPFLLDTGADCSLLMPADAKRLGIDHSKLTYDNSSTGVGGPCKEHTARARLVVQDGNLMHGYVTTIGIADPIPDLEEAPSLLGMDILQHWRITCDYTNKQVQVRVQFSDEERPAS
jgi:predicted aspartyl protease